MKKIKSLIARTIKNFGKLTAFCVLTLPAFAICCLLGSWTIDEQGNLIGNNLVNVDNVTCSLNTGTYEITNQEINIQITNTNIPEFYFEIQNLNLSTYDKVYFKAYGTNVDKLILYVRDENSHVTSLGSINNLHYINGVNSFVYGSSYWISSYPNEVFSNYQIKLMFSTEPFEFWEPYGKWYSQNNYDIALSNSYSFYYNVFNNSRQFIYANDNTYYGDGSISTLYRINHDVGGADIVHIYNNLSTDISSFRLFSWNTSFMQDFFTNHERGTMLFKLNTFINYPLYISLDDINFNYNIQVLYQDMTAITINTENLQPHLYFAKLESSFDNPIIAFAFDYYTSDYILANQKISIDTSGFNLNEYYQRGYDSASSYYGATIQQQNKELDELKSIKNDYNTLLEHYNSSQLNNPLSSMVIAIADIPLNLFHSMFNFDIMGFNLAAFILGIITILLVAYVIKLFL